MSSEGLDVILLTFSIKYKWPVLGIFMKNKHNLVIFPSSSCSRYNTKQMDTAVPDIVYV